MASFVRDALTFKCHGTSMKYLRAAVDSLILGQQIKQSTRSVGWFRHFYLLI